MPLLICLCFKKPQDHIYCIKLAACCCFFNRFGAQITGSNSNESKCVIRSQMSGKKKKKNPNCKQLLAHRVASIRLWIEKSGMPPCFLHLSPCVNQPLCHSTQTRERGIMSSYLFCIKMKYLLGVNTYQEQTMGRGASSSQTHIWLPPPQRPNHVLGVFSDSGKSASFESTFQSPCWTVGLCWNGRKTCVHTF